MGVVRDRLERWGVLPVLRFFYQLPGTLRGLWLWHFRPRKTFVLLLSAMRSGSTLLKALLAEAPDIEQIPEVEFQVRGNRFYVYQRFYRLSPLPIVVLKHPANYSDFRTYPRLPRGEFKIIRLVRNPLDTLLSLRGMNPHLEVEKSDEELMDYWATTQENLARLQHPRMATVRYEDLIEQPKAVTARLFAFIGSQQREGVDHYHKPRNYEWQWRKDDGGEVIKSLRVQKVEKDYTPHRPLAEKLWAEPRIRRMVEHFQLKMPVQIPQP